MSLLEHAKGPPLSIVRRVLGRAVSSCGETPKIVVLPFGTIASRGVTPKRDDC